MSKKTIELAREEVEYIFYKLTGWCDAACDPTNCGDCPIPDILDDLRTKLSN